MPALLYGEPNSNIGTQALRDASYEYEYPNGLNLKPGSALHTKLVNEILHRARDSQRLLAGRRKSWRRTEDSLKLYARPEWRTELDRPRQIDIDSEVSRQKKMRKDAERRRELPAIVMPTSYAAMETLLTYMTAAFLNPPIWRYDGVGPDDVYGALLLQEKIQMDAVRNGMGLNLHTMWRDSFAYGFGAVTPGWKIESGWWTESRETGYNSFFNPEEFISTGTVKERVFGTIYEGGKLRNIDPWWYFPDPNVPIHEPQEGNFVGWNQRTTYYDVVQMELDDPEHFYNCKYIRHTSGLSALIESSSSGKDRPKTENTKRELYGGTPVDVLWMYCTIVPREWKLGDSKRPEKWLFAVAADSVLISARPAGFDHNRYPVAVAAPDFDGYSVTPVSRLEVIADLQSLIDFMYTSHVHNVRKALNDMLVVDPSSINIWDLLDPNPGKIVRAQRDRWGRGTVKDGIHQLAITDITQQHVTEAQMLDQTVRGAISANDQLRGQLVHRGPRISAAASQGARESSIGHLERVAMIIGMQAMWPLGHMMACHVQQLMTDSFWVKVHGETAQRLKDEFAAEIQRGRIKVDPGDLVVDHDVMVSDGTIPGAQDSEGLLTLFQIASQSASPLVQQATDFPRLIRQIARSLGVKNADDFVKLVPAMTPQVMPDGDVESQVQQGNLVPIGDGQGGAPPMVGPGGY